MKLSNPSTLLLTALTNSTPFFVLGVDSFLLPIYGFIDKGEHFTEESYDDSFDYDEMSTAMPFKDIKQAYKTYKRAVGIWHLTGRYESDMEESIPVSLGLGLNDNQVTLLKQQLKTIVCNILGMNDAQSVEDFKQRLIGSHDATKEIAFEIPLNNLNVYHNIDWEYVPIARLVIDCNPDDLSPEYPLMAKVCLGIAARGFIATLNTAIPVPVQELVCALQSNKEAA